MHLSRRTQGPMSGALHCAGLCCYSWSGPSLRVVKARNGLRASGWASGTAWICCCRAFGSPSSTQDSSYSRRPVLLPLSESSRVCPLAPRLGGLDRAYQTVRTLARRVPSLTKPRDLRDLKAYALFVGDLGHADKRVPAHVELACCGDGLAKTLQSVGMSGLADVDHTVINVFL